MKTAIIVATVLALGGCATIVNDPNIPLTVSFSDGATGKCDFKNKRGAWSSDIASLHAPSIGEKEVHSQTREPLT